MCLSSILSLLPCTVTLQLHKHRRVRKLPFLWLDSYNLSHSSKISRRWKRNRIECKLCSPSVGERCSLCITWLFKCRQTWSRTVAHWERMENGLHYVCIIKCFWLLAVNTDETLFCTFLTIANFLEMLWYISEAILPTPADSGFQSCS